MSTDCILLVEEGSPFNFAFEMLFDQNSGIKAVRSNAKSLQDLVNEAVQMESPVVIVEDMAITTEENSLAGLLASSPQLKIILVLRESNIIYTFRMDKLMIQSSTDFLNALQQASQTQNREEVSV